MPEPLIPDVGVIALVPDRWTDVWQVRHCVMSRLCRYFHVVWENPPAEWRQVLRHPLRYRGVERCPVENLVVESPDLLLPKVYKPAFLGRALDRARLGRARDLLRRRGCRKIVLYVWRPDFHAALDDVAADLRCYDVDDDYSFTMEGESAVLPVERELMERCDRVFVHSTGLLERQGALHPNITFLPNGVDHASYATPAPEPADLAAIPHPRIGYTGQIKQELDWELLRKLADRHRSWSFVMVGPVIPYHGIDDVVADFGARPNVWLLGRKPPAELCRYPQHFDVSIMPYARNSFTRFIYPLKLHEYLAGGSPVVGTPIRSLRPFAHVVELVEGLEAWSAALRAALEPAASSEARVVERRAVARLYDWDVLVTRIAAVMAHELGGDRLARLWAALDPATAAAMQEPFVERVEPRWQEAVAWTDPAGAQPTARAEEGR